METKDKELLLKDLCARLPYGVMCNRYSNVYELVEIDIKRGLVYLLANGAYMPYSVISGDEVKPYLRPLSSMTEEEEAHVYNGHIEFWVREDYCNKHFLDYRDLIPKGLALEAPEGMYEMSWKYYPKEFSSYEE